QQLGQQFQDNFQQGFGERFGNAPFQNRYQQLNWQYQGPRAFQNPQLQQQLNLTPAQTERIQQLTNQWSTQMQQLSQTLQDNPEQLRERLRSLQASMSRQLRPVLSQQQYRQWQQMTGDPYEFPANVYFNEQDQIR